MMIGICGRNSGEKTIDTMDGFSFLYLGSVVIESAPEIDQFPFLWSKRLPIVFLVCFDCGAVGYVEFMPPATIFDGIFVVLRLLSQQLLCVASARTKFLDGRSFGQQFRHTDGSCSVEERKGREVRTLLEEFSKQS